MSRYIKEDPRQRSRSPGVFENLASQNKEEVKIRGVDRLSPTVFATERTSTTTESEGGPVVGVSLDANFNPRAFLWRKGAMTDLNTLVVASKRLLSITVRHNAERKDNA